MSYSSRIDQALDRFERDYALPRRLAVAFNVVCIGICPLFAWLLVLEATHHTAWVFLTEKLGVVGLPYTLSFIAASLVSWKLARDASRHGEPKFVVRTYALFGVFTFLVAGEHISWGQAIHEYPTPFGLHDVNVQGQFNVHNLPIVDDLHSFFLFFTGAVGLIFVRLGRRPSLRHVAVPPILTAILWTVTIMGGLSVLSDIILMPFLMSMTIMELRYAIEFVIGVSCLLYAWLNGRAMRREWSGVVASAAA